MLLDAAFTEFGYAKDHTPASRAWYRSRLGAFTTWAKGQGTTAVEDITAPLVRRYIEEPRTATSKTGKPLDSHTLHGHARAIRAFLNWAVRDELLDEKVTKRLTMPKREQKVLAIFTPAQLDLLMGACDQGETPEYVARDRAILAVLLDTGIRASELTGLTLDRAVFTADEAYLLVKGKGRKDREVGLGKKSRSLLHRYIHRARTAPTT
ncbi:MAG TPA: tyrosine-type recombinase/integrase [Ktedonobacterales bacterium]|nr:tyrosine-type recombinase/integrase [Ktedonobacterales bacterium]